MLSAVYLRRAAVAVAAAGLLVSACNHYTLTNYPAELGTYTETVVVPGMGGNELGRKIIMFQAGNPDVPFKYDIDRAGRYTVTFAGAQSNAARKAMYESAAKLRRTVYGFPLSDGEVEALMRAGFDAGGAGRAAEALARFYEVAVANPFNSHAVVAYGAALGDAERYEGAIAVLALVPEVDGVQDILANIHEQKDIRDEMIAEERRMEEERRQEELEERRRIQEEKAEKWQRIADAMSGAAEVLGQVGAAMEANQQQKSGSSGDYGAPSGGASSSGSGGSGSGKSSKSSNYNIGTARSNYNGYAETAKRYYMMDEYTTSIRQSYGDVQSRMRKIRQEAAANGHTISQSPYETKSLPKR